MRARLATSLSSMMVSAVLGAMPGTADAADRRSCLTAERFESGDHLGFRVGMSRDDALVIARRRYPSAVCKLYSFSAIYPDVPSHLEPRLRSWNDVAAVNERRETWRLKRGPSFCRLFYNRITALEFVDGRLFAIGDGVEYVGP